MEQKNGCLFLLLFVFLLTHALSVSSSASTFISACPVNFEFLNYTIITSQCKGPRYPPKPCCAALKEFACPYANELNDLTNDCATTMFSYINLYGKYPPGLFSSQCRDGKEGLDCSAPQPSESANVSGIQIICNPSPLLVLSTGLLVLLLRFF
ncbi:similar to LORELEI-LIKE-GPI-ANCHORED PROTEIN 1 [Actinidia rufa]|uniref:Similar to LORELEI-LIKE-GPI-ANCHORED PROTEIN 1 n=1 Tax=Actinidia rufa TaxID=165716 RepID=A0A7J0GPW9_9ERIC|nr:similar to LORELEI-LIKE-GPI-ANCHORED PROTEIN 1 [Actinidia rufa]